MRELTWSQVIGRRFTRSNLARQSPETKLVELVRGTPLIQAQVFAAAELCLSARVRGFTRQRLSDALYAERSLVRTWSVRGTVHLVPADEAALWAAAAVGASPYWETSAWLTEHGLTRRRVSALITAIGQSLQSRCLTRSELAAAVEGRLGWTHPLLRSGYGQLLHPAAMTGHLCFGPPKGANVTFVRADEWLGGWPQVDGDQARREVLRRYLHAFGPARPADFSTWSGFQLATARQLFAEAELEELSVEGTRAFVLPGDTTFRAPRPSVRLLPRYDAYVIGSRPRRPILPPAVEQRVKENPKGRLESVTGMQPLIVNGVVTGLWTRRDETIRLEQIIPLPATLKDELASEIERIRQFD
jgi:hypothetical protein